MLFVVPYPHGTAASQRFRFEQYLIILENANFEVKFHSFLTPKAWKVLYAKGHLFTKLIEICKGFFHRYSLLFSIKGYDYVFVHRETAPLGPPLFEWLAVKVFRRKLIYDFDDAIWIPNVSESNKIFMFLKRFGNVETLCRLAFKVSCGNSYLSNYARQFNQNVVYNPTTIDTEQLHNPSLYPEFIREKKKVIGWTGTHSTIRYVEQLVPVLEKLDRLHDFVFLVISDAKPGFSLPNLQYIRWNKNTEITDLMKIDIGVMPLQADAWSEGKCGFKALQYLALGIPAVVSPVGVNSEIVSNGFNGLICDTEHEWFEGLNLLLSDDEAYQTMANCTRKTVVERFSVQSNSANFIGLFE